MSFYKVDIVNGKRKYIHKVVCTVCNNEYEKISGNKTDLNIKNDRVFCCSKECKKMHLSAKYSLKHVSLKCNNCEFEFKVRPSEANRRFCSEKCYKHYFKTHVDEYNLMQRVVHMHKFANTENSIQKGIETKIKNGLLFDLKNRDDLDWKKFWRTCDFLTRKQRGVLIDNWDGYDFYTGQYIKENLKLPYYHGDYPVLDHIIPKTKCFNQGLTPLECCKSENLVWTTRRVNSSKYTKKWINK